MAAVLEWAGDDEEPALASFSSSPHRIRGCRTHVCPGELPTRSRPPSGAATSSVPPLDSTTRRRCQRTSLALFADELGRRNQPLTREDERLIWCMRCREATQCQSNVCTD